MSQSAGWCRWPLSLRCCPVRHVAPACLGMNQTQTPGQALDSPVAVFCSVCLVHAKSHGGGGGDGGGVAHGLRLQVDDTQSTSRTGA